MDEGLMLACLVASLVFLVGLILFVFVDNYYS
jgi:hypothetical protein